MHKCIGGDVLFEWDDLRFFLAVLRNASTVKAAKQLNVSQSTVSRRIQSLEDALGLRLFERSSQGLLLQKQAAFLPELAEAVEEKIRMIEEQSKQTKQMPSGVVRLTTVEEAASWLVVPELGSFRRKWPHIEIQLITTTRALDLMRGEADIALRMGNPGHPSLKAKKLSSFGYGVYASKTYMDKVGHQYELCDLDWLALDAELPYISKHWNAKHIPDIKPILKCSDHQTLTAAVNAGMGVAILPNPSALYSANFVKLPIDTSELRTPIWLAVHQDKYEVPSVKAVWDFLIEATEISAAKARLFLSGKKRN